MLDYPRLISERIAAAVGDEIAFNGETLRAVNVFSEADPSREWSGVPTVEVDEIGNVAKTYLNGMTRDVASVVVLVRATRRKTAAEIALWLTQNVVEPSFSVDFCDVADEFVFDGLEVAPDVRNLSVGETFAARLTYTIHGKKYFI